MKILKTEEHEQRLFKGVKGVPRKESEEQVEKARTVGTVETVGTVLGANDAEKGGVEEQKISDVGRKEGVS